MVTQQNRYNLTARHKPAIRTIAISHSGTQASRQHLTLMRLLCTAMCGAALGAALLAGSMTYAKAAASTATPDAATQDKTTPEQLPEHQKTKTDSAQPEPDSTEQTKERASGQVMPAYMDDRSTPQKLLESYYNAINRKEYARAYSYYAEGTQDDDFSKYAKGYESTQSVTIKLGSTEPDPGAGQIYWTLPIAVESTLTDGTSQVYTGCYTINISNPAMQELPPFKPMSIMTGTLSKSPLPLQKSVPEECEAP